MTTETITIPCDSVPCQNVGLDTLLTGASLAPLHSMGLIRVTGDDRVRWLNGMATNSIQALQPGDGCYTFFLNAQGRIQADATAWMLDDSILLEAQRERIPALISHLDHFIIMDDVELASVPLEGLLVVGPDALSAVQNLGGTPRSLPQPPATLTATLNLKQTAYQGAPIYLMEAYSPLVPRFEVWAAPETIASITAKLATIPQATREALDALRLLEGTPLYGTDIRDRELPQETTQTRALHFAKGCYLGQEIVERIRSRGNVHRTLSGFTLSGEVPAPGAPLFTESPDKPIGEITSATTIPLPAGPVTLALGYIRREVLERGTPISYEGGAAMPTVLPYKP
jgi:aminomethyltransferase